VDVVVLSQLMSVAPLRSDPALRSSVELTEDAVRHPYPPPWVLKAIFCGEICWILSEVTWILLIPQVCVPAGALACAFIGSVAVFTTFVGGRDDSAQSFSLLFQFFWLLINFVWMSDEVLWDAPDQPPPWNFTPIAQENEDLFSTIEFPCAIAFCSLFIIFFTVVFIAHFFGHRIVGLPSAKDLLISTGYLSTWALMDGLWAFETVAWLAPTAALITVFLVPLSSIAETGLGWRGVDRTDVVWILWTLSNFLWIWTEQVEDEDLTYRYFAAVVAVASLLLLLGSFKQVKAREEAPTNDLCNDA